MNDAYWYSVVHCVPVADLSLVIIGGMGGGVQRVRCSGSNSDSLAVYTGVQPLPAFHVCGRLYAVPGGMGRMLTFTLNQLKLPCTKDLNEGFTTYVYFEHKKGVGTCNPRKGQCLSSGPHLFQKIFV